jgi:hypothetical protein
MNDGDSLLDTDPNSLYMQTIMSSARSLLDEHGQEHIVVKYVNVSHNILRCSELTTKLLDLSLPVWIFDVGLYFILFIFIFISYFIFFWLINLFLSDALDDKNLWDGIGC